MVLDVKCLGGPEVRESQIDEIELEKMEKHFKEKFDMIGNIVHDSVRVSNNEDDNEVIREWGDAVPKPEGLKHYEILEKLGAYDCARGAKVAGSRGYFLKGVGVLLNQALIAYGIQFLLQKAYIPLQTPYFMNKDVMAATAQLDDFDKQLYKVTGATRRTNNNENNTNNTNNNTNNNNNTENNNNNNNNNDNNYKEIEEKYLIATSEQPISAMHMNECLKEEELPIRYAGYSMCFRKEAGQMRDANGIFRVHQFEKIEQFVITHPNKSWEMLEEMIGTSEEFYKSLEIPYRVVVIVSGALNNAAAKKYDLEGYFPRFQGYRELVSCSNCTDYQSRSLNIKMRAKNGAEGPYVHMLNSTLCATTRTMCALVENHQTTNGVNVPAALQPFLGGKTFLPFLA